MSGYKRVNYYELCRLCTSTEGTRIHIFREDGRKKHLPTKIKNCLSLKIQESDLLPKMICINCLNKLEELNNFHNLCLEAEKMLLDFRSKLKHLAPDSGEKLQVYVKDSSSNSILSSMKKKHISNDAVTELSNGLETSAVLPETTSESTHDKRTIAMTPMPIRINDEIPLPCSVSLKFNGLHSSVPVNVENISSLMQIVSDNEISRIQKFNIPLQSEITVFNDTESPRFNVTLQPNEPIQKEAANVMQSLQCGVSLNNNMSVSRMSMPSTTQSTITFDTSTTPVSLISSTISQDNNLHDMVMQVNLTKDGSEINSVCSHCGKVLECHDEICNCIVSSSDVSRQSDGSRPVIQTNNVLFVDEESPKSTLPEEGISFNCEICGKFFKKREHLLQHQKLHTGVRPYVCGSCGKSFSRKEHLFRHTLAHTGEKRHLCTLCGKTFSRKDNLHKHRRTHGITGPYECEICRKSFIVKHYYQMHMANHSASDTEEMPFHCDICKKGFVKEEFLNTHKVRHRVRVNQRIPATSTETAMASTEQVEESNLSSTINSVAILPSNVVQQNVRSDNTIYFSAQQSPFTFTSTATMSTTSGTQTPLFTANLATNSQFLDTYRHLNSTIVPT